MLSAAVRYYDIDILATLAAGQRLNGAQQETLRQHLAKNGGEIAKVLGAIGVAAS